VTGALCGDQAKWTLRAGSRLLSITVPRRVIGCLMEGKTTEDKSIRRSACRHTESNARHHRLDGERISEKDGQKATPQSQPNKSSQAFHLTLTIARTERLGDKSAVE